MKHTIRKITAAVMSCTLCWSVITVTSSTGSLTASALAARYDLREEAPDLLTPVKRQIGGTCWAHAAIACAESNLIKKGIAESGIDLSEAHLIWFTHGQDSPTDPKDPSYGGGVNKGVEGYDGGAQIRNTIATLAAWTGAVQESDAPTLAEQKPMDESLRYQSAAHLQNADIFDPNNIQDIKYRLSKKGPLYLEYYSMSEEELSEKSGYYNSKYVRLRGVDNGGGHAVQLIGWDDGYKKENFKSPPPDDGAWICKNSWGNYTRSENGYFYLSYYEPSIAHVCSLDFEPVTNYGSVHHYNNSELHALSSGKLREQKSGTEFANVFEAEQDEKITAIGFFNTVFDSADVYTASCEYEAEVYLLNADFKDPRDGTLVTKTDGLLEYSGFHTLRLPQNCSVKKGQKYSVVVKLPFDDISTTYFDTHCYKKGVSFFTYYSQYNEESWKDCYENDEGDCTIHVYTAYEGEQQQTEPVKNKEGTYIDLFPDPLIRECLLEYFDADQDQYLTKEELLSLNYDPYDIDRDGQANAKDLTILKRGVLGQAEPGTGYFWKVADINADSYINETDVEGMLNYVLQRPPKKK